MILNETLTTQINESPQVVFMSCHSKHLQIKLGRGGGGRREGVYNGEGYIVFPTFDTVCMFVLHLI